MIVTSPGGFIGGVTPSNIITHPAEPRYRSLAEAMASLRLAERKGIGVDRMIRDMLAIGRPSPEFYQVAGPYVGVSLIGGDPDPVMIGFLNAIQPAASDADVDLLLVLQHLVHHGWVDARSAAPVLQRSVTESGAALQRIGEATSDGHPIIDRVRGVPVDHPPAFRLSGYSRDVFAHLLGPTQAPEGREALILHWARSRGRVSSTEVSDLTGLTVMYSGKLLSSLADDGLLVGSRPRKAGRGFHYLPVSADTT